MTLAITLNIILGGAVVIGVVAPLLWAVLTQHRDEPVAIVTPGTRRVRARVARRPRRRALNEPIVRQAR